MPYYARLEIHKRYERGNVGDHFYELMKESLLHLIKGSRKLMREWDDMAKLYPEHASDYLSFAAHEQHCIKKYIAELTALKRTLPEVQRQMAIREEKRRQQFEEGIHE